eukprot:tig00000655_g2846.t1
MVERESLTLRAFEASRLASADPRKSRLLLICGIDGGSSCVVPSRSSAAADTTFDASIFLAGPPASSDRRPQPHVLTARVCDLNGKECGAARLDLSALLNASSPASRCCHRYYILKTANGTPAGQLRLAISAGGAPRRVHVPGEPSAEDALTAGFDAEAAARRTPLAPPPITCTQALEPEADSEPEAGAEGAVVEEEGAEPEPPALGRSASVRSPVEALSLKKDGTPPRGDPGPEEAAGAALDARPLLVHCDSFAAMLARKPRAAVPFPQFAAPAPDAQEGPAAPPPAAVEVEEEEGEGLLEPGESIGAGTSSRSLGRSSAGGSAPGGDGADDGEVPPAQHGGDGCGPRRGSAGHRPAGAAPSPPPLEEDSRHGHSPPHVPVPQFQAVLDD